MAIFHLTTKVISRGKGQSAIAAAAYRSGERLRDEQANEQKFYQARAERIEFTGIYAPKDAPEWAQDRNRFWNEAERAETRKDGRLAREIEIALPHELTAEQRRWAVQDFVREAFVRKGYAVDVAIHAPDKESDARNHHAHILIAERKLGADGFAKMKDPAMNKREQLTEWREQWAHVANRHLERHGHAERIDHRSLKEQGVEREPTIHLGYAANEMAQRGAQSDRMDRLKGVIERNDIRLEMKALDREAAGLERSVSHPAPQAPSPKVAAKGLEVADRATGMVSGLADFIGKILEAPFSSPSSTEPNDEIARDYPRFAAAKAEQEAEQALESIQEDMGRGSALSASDVQHLTRAQQETIRARGDDGLREMIDDMQRRKERSWRDNERDREGRELD